MKAFTIATVLALVATMAFAGLASARAERPMAGSFTVSIVGVDPRCGTDLTIGFAGIGVARHLGRITGSGSNCTEADAPFGAVPIYQGVAMFVAADGSTLTFAYEGEQAAPVNFVATAVTTNIVVSGTGRFANAAGEWTNVGTIDFIAGTFSGSFAGWISY